MVSKIQAMKQCIVILLLFSILSCTKETITQNTPVVDEYLYEINGETLYQSNLEKDKEKSSEQYVSILFTNLFQTTVPQDDLFELAEIRTATGDKQLADELLLNGMVNNDQVIIPSGELMRFDPETFIRQTFNRFYLREPTPYEMIELKKIIEDDPFIEPEIIYQAFALSNEYKFY